MKNEKRDLSIEALAYGGDGIARPEGFTIFVPRTVPGDKVRVEMTVTKKRYGRGLPLEILEASPLRTEPKCPHYKECGGCHYQQIDPAYVAEQKVLQVQDALERIGKEKADVLPLVVPSQQWGYRNRVTYHRKGTTSGYIAWKGERVIDIPDCPIAQPELNTLWKEVRKRIEKIPAAQIRFVFLRRTTSGELAVLFSVAAPTVLHKVAREWDLDASLWFSVVEHDAASPFGDEIGLLKGGERMTESVGEIQYQVRPDLFFQIHPEVTEKVVEKVLSWANEIKPKRVLDLYCGSGLFTLALTKAGYPTYGVEVSHEAILCAQTSLDENALDSTVWLRTGKADQIVEKLIEEEESFDAAIVDPPRKGIHPEIIKKLSKLGVKHLLYISCSPATLARDVKALKEEGFQLNWTQPFDMFPQTYHVETVSGFSSRK